MLDFNDTPAGSVSPQIDRRSVWAERLDLAGAWMTATVAGAVLVSIISERTPFLRMTGPLVVMALYVSFALSRSRFSTSKVADSVYFMGFLWTLWALIDLLIIGGSKLGAQDLYVAFGYALTATAAGMFCRLSILQFFRTVEDQENEAVDSIDVHVKRLIGQIDESSRAVAGIRNDAAVKLQEWQEELSAEAQKHLAVVAKLAVDFEAKGQGLTDAVDAVRQSVSSTGRTFSGLEKRITGWTGKLFDALDEAAKALERSIRELTARISAIEIPNDLLAAPVAQAVADVTAAATDLRNLATDALSQLKSSIDEVGASAKNLPKSKELDAAMTCLVGQLAALSSACGSFTTEMGNATISLDGAGNAMKRTQDRVNAASDDLALQVQRVQSALDDAHASVQAVHGGAGKAADTLKEVVTFVNRQLAN